jgi:hypothetical protein
MNDIFIKGAKLSLIFVNSKDCLEELQKYLILG